MSSVHERAKFLKTNQSFFYLKLRFPCFQHMEAWNRTTTWYIRTRRQWCFLGDFVNATTSSSSSLSLSSSSSSSSLFLLRWEDSGGGNTWTSSSSSSSTSSFSSPSSFPPSTSATAALTASDCPTGWTRYPAP